MEIAPDRHGACVDLLVAIALHVWYGTWSRAGGPQLRPARARNGAITGVRAKLRPVVRTLMKEMRVALRNRVVVMTLGVLIALVAGVMIGNADAAVVKRVQVAPTVSIGASTAGTAGTLGYALSDATKA